MQASAVMAPLLLLLAVSVQQTVAVEEFAAVPERRPCQTKQGGLGECVSLRSGQCTLFTSTVHLLLRRPSLCGVTARDVTVCCPTTAVRETGRRAAQPGSTGTTGTTLRPTRPPPRTTRPPPRTTLPPPRTTRPPPRTTRPPPRTTRPPPRTTRPLPTTPAAQPITRPSRPTAPAAQPTPPTGAESSTRRDLQSPLGLRPRPSLSPISSTSPQPPVDHRLPGCGRAQPLPAFRAGGEYFSRRPLFAAAESVLLGTQPWTALVGVMAPSGGGRWICAGALVTPRAVLTAASCAVLGGSPERLAVGLGEHDLLSRSDGVAGMHAVLAVERHPDWHQPGQRHALAVLLLVRPADHSPLIRPVCLPPADPPLSTLIQEEQLSPLPGSSAVEVAYDLDPTGMNDQSARNRLVATPTTVTRLAVCGAALAATPLGEFLFPGGPRPETELCLSTARSCAPDAGSLLVTTAPDGAVQLEGIQILDGCTAGQPRLVLRVRQYVPYIVQTVNKLMQLVNPSNIMAAEP